MEASNRAQIEHSYVVHLPSLHIEESQPSPDSSGNLLIIEDSSDSISSNDNNGIVSDSCVERDHLLNQDNTLFLNINTQLTSSNTSASTIKEPTMPRPASLQSNLAQIEENSSATALTKQPSHLNVINNDRSEFLPIIDIENVTSNIENVQISSEETFQLLNINLTLKHQCNGKKCITANGNAMKLILNLNDEEWGAVHAILSNLKESQYDPTRRRPINKNISYRAIHCLIKNAPKLSNFHITYGDQDFETARVFVKPFLCNEIVETAIDTHILSQMKAKEQNLKQLS